MATAALVNRIQTVAPGYAQVKTPSRSKPAPPIRLDTVTISPQARALTLSLQGLTPEQIALRLSVDLKIVRGYLAIKAEA